MDTLPKQDQQQAESHSIDNKIVGLISGFLAGILVETMVSDVWLDTPKSNAVESVILGTGIFPLFFRYLGGESWRRAYVGSAFAALGYMAGQTVIMAAKHYNMTSSAP
ncbi:hypothetical protein HYS48_01155 [Candidatus Woesearchaeota archaeon]|nr:hypothetical protein [Candidatus Woesearchaeota archaeon]